MTDRATSATTTGARAADTASVRRFPRQAFPPDTVPRYRPVERQCNSLGTAALVLGLLAVVLCWVPIVGVLCGLLGVVFGCYGRAAGTRNGTGTRPAVAGLVLGLVSLVPAVIIIVAVATA